SPRPPRDDAGPIGRAFVPADAAKVPALQHRLGGCVSAPQNRPQVQEDAQIPLLTYTAWQMSFGDRAALEGLLAQCRPRLAIEIGTADGGSLERVAAYSEEVHSFDLARPTGTPGELANVSFHEGDSHVVLPEFLAELAAA